MRTMSLILAVFGLLAFALPAAALDGHEQGEADVAAPPDGSGEAEEAEAAEGTEDAGEAEEEAPKPE